MPMYWSPRLKYLSKGGLVLPLTGQGIGDAVEKSKALCASQDLLCPARWASVAFSVGEEERVHALPVWFA